jgi:prophage regulatory protein
MKIIDIQQLPNSGFVTIQELCVSPSENKKDIGIRPILPISRQSWMRGIKSGRFPAPVILPNSPKLWRVKDIKAVVNGTFNNKGAK